MLGLSLKTVPISIMWLLLEKPLEFLTTKILLKDSDVRETSKI